jgi:hypothetical protein
VKNSLLYKIGGIVLFIIILIIIFSAYIYPTYIYKNNVNIWDGISLQYSNAHLEDIVWGSVANYQGPLSGYSQPSVKESQPISNNVEINDFYKNITYKINNEGIVKDSDKLVNAH